MEDIAACADISPATLYNFFPTKLDILTEVFAAQLDALLGELHVRPARAAGRPVEAVCQLIRRLFEALATFDRGLLRRVTLHALNEGPAQDGGARYALVERDMVDELVNVIGAQQAAGQLRVGLSATQAAEAIFACANGEYYAWLSDDTASLEAVLSRIDRHVTLILHGGTAPPIGAA